MACKVKVNRHGRLAFRLFWNGRDSWEGTRWKDTPKNRLTAEADALRISEEMKRGEFDYLKWFPDGNKADEFRPKSEAKADAKSLTVGEYYRDWIERRKPPFVRPGLHHYVRQFAGISLPNFETTRLVDVDLTTASECVIALGIPVVEALKAIKPLHVTETDLVIQEQRGAAYQRR